MNIFNQIKHILIYQVIENKLFRLPIKPDTIDHIGDVLKVPFGTNIVTPFFSIMTRFQTAQYSVPLFYVPSPQIHSIYSVHDFLPSEIKNSKKIWIIFTQLFLWIKYYRRG